MKLRRNILIALACFGLAFNANASAPYLLQIAAMLPILRKTTTKPLPITPTF